MANDNIVAVHPFRDAGREATGAELMHANPYRPVSYTHLDVYKRQ